MTDPETPVAGKRASAESNAGNEYPQDCVRTYRPAGGEHEGKYPRETPQNGKKRGGIEPGA